MKIGKLTVNPFTSEMEFEDIELSAKEITDLEKLVNSLKELQLSYRPQRPVTLQATKTAPKKDS